VVTSYTDPSIDGPQGIAVGPDGALWFTNFFSNSIGRMTTSGVATSYTDPTIDGPLRIAAGPDGALWFTNYYGNSIGRITTSGVVTNYGDPSISSPNGITAGPDGGVWFANTGNNSIGRIQPSETPTQLCQLTVSYVESSAKYQALPASARNAINQLSTLACNQLGTMGPKLTARQLALAITAYKAAVTALANGGWLTSSQASTLTAMASNLTLT
jgi:streptogramin lyase